jgi:hypothetical protein
MVISHEWGRRKTMNFRGRSKRTRGYSSPSLSSLIQRELLAVGGDLLIEKAKVDGDAITKKKKAGFPEKPGFKFRV